MTEPVASLDVDITALAAGGDGVARDADGRVTFVPRTAPGDRVRVRLTKQTKSFARAELVDVVMPSPSRVEPPCEAFVRGCGGCQWQHVARAAQLEAKQALVANALRKLGGLKLETIADPAPPLGWRRRARFHVLGGKLGLYREGSTTLVPLSHCPQLEPALDAVLALIAPRTPPDGELAVVIGHTGAIAIGVEKPWRGAAQLVGRAGIVGIVAAKDVVGDPVIEVEPGLFGGPWDFAQASAPGNAALVALVDAAVGAGTGNLLELYAGAGNFTRGLVAAGWNVTASDGVTPPKPVAGATFVAGATASVLAGLTTGFDVVVLDPPRAGAADAIDGIVKLQPRTIVYISCDPATLARDADKLQSAGWRPDRAWPVDLMPQTAHVEIVMKMTKSVRSSR